MTSFHIILPSLATSSVFVPLLTLGFSIASRFKGEIMDTTDCPESYKGRRGLEFFGDSGELVPLTIPSEDSVGLTEESWSVPLSSRSLCLSDKRRNQNILEKLS